MASGEFSGARRFVLALVAGCCLAAGAASAADAQDQADKSVLHVLTSGGFTSALQTLAPLYEKTAHIHVEIGYGPSMGSTPNAIPMRLERGEAADLVIMVREALDGLVTKGQVVPADLTDLAQSRIALAVKAGTPVPDISTVSAFRQTLATARSVAWSDSASGVFLQTVVFPKLGLAESMKAKGRMIPATPVGMIVAKGDAALGFQQLSELKPVSGITIVGPIPEEVQKVTTFSAGLVARSTQQSAARAFIAFLASADARGAITASGMTPAAAREPK